MRVSSRYEQRATPETAKYQGVLSPVIKTLEKGHSQPARRDVSQKGERTKTPVRTLVLTGAIRSGSGREEGKSASVSGPLSAQRRLASPKKVSASIPSFQIALPPPPPELKEKASTVLKNLRQTGPSLSARGPAVASSRSRVRESKD